MKNLSEFVRNTYIVIASLLIFLFYEQQVSNHVFGFQVSQVPARNTDLPLVSKVQSAVTVESSIFISLKLDGSQFINRIKSLSVADPIGKLSLLRSPSVQDELEIDDTKKRHLTVLFKEADKAREKLMLDHLYKSAKLDDSFLRDWNSSCIELEDRLASYLSEKEKKRLEEIGFRVYFRTHGFVELIDELNSRGELVWNLSADEKTKLKSTAKTLNDDLLKTRQELQESEVSQLFAILTTKQIDRLKQIGGKFFDSTGSIDIFREQVRNVELPKSVDNLGSSPSDLELLFSRMQKPLFYALEDDGSLRRCDLGDYGFLKTPMEPGQLEIYQDVLDSLCFGGLGELIDVTDAQALSLTSMLQNAMEVSAKIQRFVEDSDTPYFAIHNALDMQNGFQQQEQPKLHTVLTDFQIRKLNNCLVLADITRYGLVANLLDGPFSRELNVTVEQKNKLRSFSSDSVERIDTRSRDLENFCLEKLISELDESHRKAVRKAVGGSLEKMPSIFLLQIDNLEKIQQN